MSCFNSNCYLPQPPRAWSRVQNSCSLITDTDNNGLVRDPYTGQLVPAVVLAERIAMLNKGNVLQYKANSSNLTKSQKYSKIAKGQWVNRNTTWATQSTRGYTNPNTTSLKRDGNINVAIDPITGAIIGPTVAPPTCPQPIIQDNEGLPSNGGGGSSIIDPEIPPPVPPTPGSDVFPVIIPDTPPEPIVIQDGGNLICSVQEDICTGETKRSLSQQLCHPTTDSDVPGPIQDLCWNDGTQTWYPRQRYVMTNSANKWPVNAELFSAIIINPPVITTISSDRNVVTLTWTLNNDCLSASFFNIYQDGTLIKVVNGNIFTTTLIVGNCNTYEYYIKAENITAKATSEASNVVSIDVYYVEPPINLSYITTGSGSIQLTWNLPNPNCQPAVSYNVYQDGIFIGNTVSLNNPVSSLTNCDSYTFSVTSVDNEGNESLPAILNNVIPLWPNPPSYIGGFYNSGTAITVYWGLPSVNCLIPTSYKIYYSSTSGSGVEEYTVISYSDTFDYTIDGLTPNIPYTLYITSLYNSEESIPSSSTIVTPTILPDLYTTTNAFASYFSNPSNPNGGNFYYIIFKPPMSLPGSIQFLYNFYTTPIYVAAVGGGGAGAWGSTSGGGAGGGQVINTYTNINVNVSNTFTITQMGQGGSYVSNGNGNPGTSTILIDPSGNTLTVTGGAGGSKTAGTNAAQGSYSGPPATFSGGGGNGGRNANPNNCSNNTSAKGGDSYFYINSTTTNTINTTLGFNFLNFLQTTFSVRIGGGGSGTATTGGEGGSQNGTGKGGFQSCSLNLSTQNAGGPGAGGGAYEGRTINYVNHSGAGGNGGVIVFFPNPRFYTQGPVNYSIQGLYTVFTFNYSSQTQKIIFNSLATNPITSINIIVVGGGGAGSAGYTGNGTTQDPGSGGSGGGVIVTTNISPTPISPTTTWTIQVGQGGTCGSTDGSIGSGGGTTSFACSGNIYVATGGQQPTGSFNAGNPGTGTFSDGVNPSQPISGSNGGQGAQCAGGSGGFTGGVAQTPQTTTLYGTTYNFSGGGGSGLEQDSVYGNDTDGYAGYAGTNLGGAGGSSGGIINAAGQNAPVGLNDYGCGGGGGCLQVVGGSPTVYPGGNGADGVVIIYFLTPT
jgi:hypothetical protein